LVPSVGKPPRDFLIFCYYHIKSEKGRGRRGIGQYYVGIVAGKSLAFHGIGLVFVHKNLLNKFLHCLLRTGVDKGNTFEGPF
jgi:hypothetical protein